MGAVTHAGLESGKRAGRSRAGAKDDWINFGVPLAIIVLLLLVLGLLSWLGSY